MTQPTNTPSFKPSEEMLKRFGLEDRMQEELNSACKLLSDSYSQSIEERLGKLLIAIEGREPTTEEIHKHASLVYEQMAGDWWRRYSWKGQLILSASNLIWPAIHSGEPADGEYRRMPTWLIIDESET